MPRFLLTSRKPLQQRVLSLGHWFLEQDAFSLFGGFSELLRTKVHWFQYGLETARYLLLKGFYDVLRCGVCPGGRDLTSLRQRSRL